VRFLLGKKIDAVMRYATMVTVGNDYLAERAYSAGAKRVEYLPTVIDLDRYKIYQSRQNEVFTIGWIGTPLTAKYLNEVAAALEAVAKKKRIHLLTVGLNSLSLPGVAVETVPWSEDTEVEQINSFDVGIMPLPDDAWERGKCGYKLIQYMACGVPVIASPVSVNQKIVEPGKNGFLARTQSEWTDALITLIANQALAKQMGQFGRTKVENEYCLQVTAPKLLNLIHQATF
jgi:glycosyltransferase involved in cell wall biosynthesis